MGVIMRQFRRLPLWLVLILLTGLTPPMEAAQASLVCSDFHSERLKERALEAYMKLPLYFIANRGQLDEHVAYYVQGGGHSIYFTAEEMVMALRPGSGQALDESVLRLRFVGAKATQPVGVEKTAAKVHYFIGNDPAKWRRDIPTYSEIVYRDLYPGVDLRCAGQNGALKYSFVVNQGADPAQIRLAYQGAEGLRIEETGDLVIETAKGELRDTKPSAYQEIGGRRVEVEVAFEVRGSGVYGFALRGDHDPRYPLVIDPTLLYSTYLGGSAADRGVGIAVDGAGSAYVTGCTGSANFPTQSPYQGAMAGATDAFVTKLNAAGSALLYSTYLGGSSDDQGYDIAVDGAGNAYVTGYTDSTNFPTQNPYQGANARLSDVFVTKFNAAGNALLYSTYLGGAVVTMAMASLWMGPATLT